MVALASLTRRGFADGDLSTVMSPRTVVTWAQNATLFHDPGPRVQADLSEPLRRGRARAGHRVLPAGDGRRSSPPSDRRPACANRPQRSGRHQRARFRLAPSRRCRRARARWRAPTTWTSRPRAPLRPRSGRCAPTQTGPPSAAAFTIRPSTGVTCPQPEGAARLFGQLEQGRLDACGAAWLRGVGSQPAGPPRQGRRRPALAVLRAVQRPARAARKDRRSWHACGRVSPPPCCRR